MCVRVCVCMCTCVCVRVRVHCWATCLFMFFTAGSEGEVAEAVAANIVFVPDRPFNDLRYPLDCTRLKELGWTETVSWKDGLRRTVEWYRHKSGNWDDVESALVAHPRRGHLAAQLTHTKAGRR